VGCTSPSRPPRLGALLRPTLILLITTLLVATSVYAGGPEELQADRMLVETLSDALESQTLALRHAGPTSREPLLQQLGATTREVLRTSRFSASPHSSRQVACQASTVYRLLPPRIRRAHPVDDALLAEPGCGDCDCLLLLGQQVETTEVWNWIGR
jgi:hypothetical protein